MEDLTRVLNYHTSKAISTEDGCLLYQGFITVDGYGTFTFRRKTYYIHRLALMVKNGMNSIDRSIIARHTCRNCNCFAADHISIGTSAENMYDQVRDGTSTHGKGSSFGTEFIREVKNSKGEGTMGERALRFGVSRQLIYDIDNKRSWNWVGHTSELDDKTLKNEKKHQNPKRIDFAKERQRIRDHSHLSDGECWIWTRGLNKAGYGLCSFGGMTRKAHVAAYLSFNNLNEISNRYHIAHECGQRKCVNPKHLRAKTPTENAVDKFKHGTISKILKVSDVVRIRSNQENWNRHQWANEYKVSRNTIRDILTKKSWKCC